MFYQYSIVIIYPDILSNDNFTVQIMVIKSNFNSTGFNFAIFIDKNAINRCLKAFFQLQIVVVALRFCLQKKALASKEVK